MAQVARQTTPPQHVDLPRGIYRNKARVSGAPLYFAVGEGGVVLDERRRRRWESDAVIVADLADLLDALDPPVTRLSLV